MYIGGGREQTQNVSGPLCSVKANGIHWNLLQMAVERTGEATWKSYHGEVEQRVGLWNASHVDVSTAVVGQLKINGTCWDDKNLAFWIGLE